MDRIVRRAVVLLAACAVSSMSAHAQAVSGELTGTQGDAFGAHALAAPVLWLLGTVGVPVEPPSRLPNSRSLEREQGWRQLECGVSDTGLGVYFEVRGRVEFASAEVRFADGTVRALDLGHAVRGRGLYELVEFGSLQPVATVVLRARARSAHAEVGVRLGR